MPIWCMTFGRTFRRPAAQASRLGIGAQVDSLPLVISRLSKRGSDTRGRSSELDNTLAQLIVNRSSLGDFHSARGLIRLMG